MEHQTKGILLQRKKRKKKNHLTKKHQKRKIKSQENTKAKQFIPVQEAENIISIPTGIKHT